MKISKNFSRSEFECKCGCGFAAVDAELLRVLEFVRDHFDKPVYINSACRCPDHNKAVGGKPSNPEDKTKGSKHLVGIAADIRVKDIDPGNVYLFLSRFFDGKYGIGRYSSFTHIDVRAENERW